jgi:transposase-like protein
MAEELLVARGIAVGPETIRRWAPKFARTFANRIRRRLPPLIPEFARSAVTIAVGRKQAGSQ